MSFKIKASCLKVSTAAIFTLFFQVAGAQLDTAALGNIISEKTRLLKTDAAFMVASKDSTFYIRDSRSFKADRAKAPAGHISQFFTTILALQLVDEGKIDLDDKIAQYLPAFAKYGKSFVTIRTCLTHYTGIQLDSRPFARITRSLEDEVNSYAAREILSNPGTDAKYTDRGFIIVARILEIVSKKKFEMLAQQKLFRPMGMRQTTFNTLDGSAPNPANGAMTSANDLAMMGYMLLQEGNFKGMQILSKESVAALRRIHVTGDKLKHTMKPLLNTDYALGAWAPEAAQEKASSLLIPSMGGTTFIIDFCRGYTAALLLKTLSENPKSEAAADLKAVLDEHYRNTCK